MGALFAFQGQFLQTFEAGAVILAGELLAQVFQLAQGLCGLRKISEFQKVAKHGVIFVARAPGYVEGHDFRVAQLRAFVSQDSRCRHWAIHRARAVMLLHGGGDGLQFRRAHRFTVQPFPDLNH